MIVLPMVGLSNRFFAAGYTVPKYMLDLHGHTVFAHALGSFSNLFGIERFLIVCRDIYDTPAFIAAQCAVLGLTMQDVDVVVLPEVTKGQAETVCQGLRAAGTPHDVPLTIFNIDTFRPGFRHPDGYALDIIDGYLEVFSGQGEHWSFVRPDATRPGEFRVAEVTEKIRISDLCCTGLYYFGTVGLFLKLYATIEDADPFKLQGGEKYVAPLYNIAIRSGLDIRYAEIRPDTVHFCGLPNEYDMLRAGPPPLSPPPVSLGRRQ